MENNPHWTDFLLAPPSLTPEYIVEDGEDWWVCKCGNQPNSDGYFPSSDIGEIVSPDVGGGWDQIHYVCHRCWRIINQNTLEIVGRCGEDAINHNTEFNWDSY